MFMDQENCLNAPPHANLVELFTHPLKSCRYAGIPLKQWVLGAKCVVRKRVPVKGIEMYSSQE